MVWFGVSVHPTETGPLAAQRKDSNNIIFLQKIFYYSNIFSSYGFGMWVKEFLVNRIPEETKISYFTFRKEISSYRRGELSRYFQLPSSSFASKLYLAIPNAN